MKKITTIAKAVLTMIIFMAAIRESSAATFTAVANGNWTSNATWGLSAPGVNITGADVIVIPAGITVTLDADVTVNHSLALISVLGTLSGSHDLTITSGDLTQSGSIAVNALTIGATGYLTSTGAITVSNFTNMQAALALASDVTVNGMLMLSAGAIQLNTGSSIQLGNNATVHISGGSLSINGGAVNVAGNYNLTYSGSASSIGLEASLPGLQNVTINLPAPSANIQLQGDLTVSGQLDLQQGTLVLSGNDLTINGTISTSANASVSATAASNITISGSGAVGTIAFSTTANTVGNLTVNTSGGSGSISLGSDVTVTGALTLQAGTLNLSGNDLTLSGTIDASGSGSISSSASSNITITGSSNVGTIDFSTGSSVVGNLTINITGLDGSVSLGTDVTVNGTLTISAGTLALNGFNLTTGGAIQISGSGAIGGHVNSDISINGSGSIGTIVLTGSGSTIHDLTINVSGGGSVALGSDVTIAGALTLQSGTFTLSGNDLTLSGTIDASGSGSISSSASSDITITGSGNVGTIEFTAGSQTVGDFTVNLSGQWGTVTLGSDMTVAGELSLATGNIALGSFDLTIESSGSIQGGSAGGYIDASGSGSLIMSLGATGGSATFQVGTSTGYAPVIITNNSATAGQFMVSTNAGVFANGTSGADISATESVVNVSWDIATDISANVNAEVEAFWSAAMEVNAFNRAQAYVSHYVNGAWDVSASAQATAHLDGTFSVTRNNITSFSPFAVFDNNTTTAIEDVADMPVLSIFPNPASNVMNVAVSEVGGNYRIRIYDATGRIMAENLITSTNTAFDISAWERGVYFVSVNNSRASVFVKQ